MENRHADASQGVKGYQSPFQGHSHLVDQATPLTVTILCKNQGFVLSYKDGVH